MTYPQVGANNSGYSFVISGFTAPIPTNGSLTIQFPNSFTLPSNLDIFSSQCQIKTYNILNQLITVNISQSCSSMDLTLNPLSNMTGIMVKDNITYFLKIATFNQNLTQIDVNSSVPVFGIMPSTITSICYKFFLYL